MFNKITTIAALSTFAACSTPFDSSDIDSPKVPLADTIITGDIASMSVSIDAQRSLSHADVGSPVLDIIETEMPEHEEVSVSTPVITEAPERLSSRFDMEVPYDLSALLVKRVDSFLNIRMYPGSDVHAKVCLQRPAGEVCFKGQASAFDKDHGGELAIELDRGETARSFTVYVSDSDVEYDMMGPFSMPEEDNLWNELIDCESRLVIEDFRYKLMDVGEDNVARIQYYSIDPTSALICGVDEAGDGACAWEPVGTGKKELKMRVSSSEEAPEVVVRDEMGCSISLGPTN